MPKVVYIVINIVDTFYNITELEHVFSTLKLAEEYIEKNPYKYKSLSIVELEMD